MFELDPGEIGKAFLVLFAVIDIIGGTPMILQVRKQAGKIYPARATIVSGAIMITFLFVGEAILGFVGVDVRSFAVAGSLVLFFLALEMVLGIRLFKEDTSAPGLPSSDPKVYSIVPLAFPVIAGAGTITTVLSLRAELHAINILVAILLMVSAAIAVSWQHANPMFVVAALLFAVEYDPEVVHIRLNARYDTVRVVAGIGHP